MNPIRILPVALSASLALFVAAGTAHAAPKDAAAGTAKKKAGKGGGFQEVFKVNKADLASVGKNDFMSLEPGYQLTLEGTEDGQKLKLVITVLDRTEKVDGVETRVIEEWEAKDGVVVEISYNFYAIHKKTNDIYYFGEDVDMFKDGQLKSHDGAWRSGVAKARFGLFMPGKAVVGAKYYQEQAPGVAMDRFEVLSVSESFETPAGKFTGCLAAEETTPIEPDKAVKLYAPGVGLVKDGAAVLVKYGTGKSPAKSAAAPAAKPAAPATAAVAKPAAPAVAPALAPAPGAKAAVPAGAKPATPAGAPPAAAAAQPDETEMTEGQAPAPVVAQLRKLHPKGEIKEIKRENHADGRVIFAVEIMVDGHQWDVEIGPDGKVLANKAE